MDANRADEEGSVVEPVELSFHAPVNHDGVVDGLVLAEALFQKGFAFLLSYTRGCPMCAGAIMGVFGDRIMEQAMESWQVRGGVPSAALIFDDDPQRRALAMIKAAEDARPRVQELLAENAERTGQPACKH